MPLLLLLIVKGSYRMQLPPFLQLRQLTELLLLLLLLLLGQLLLAPAQLGQLQGRLGSGGGGSRGLLDVERPVEYFL